MQHCYLPRWQISYLISPNLLQFVAAHATALHDDAVSARMIPTMDARRLRHGSERYVWPWRCRLCGRCGLHRQRSRGPETALRIERPKLLSRIDVAGPAGHGRAARRPLPKYFSAVIDVGTGKRLPTEIRLQAPRQLHGDAQLSSTSVCRGRSQEV